MRAMLLGLLAIAGTAILATPVSVSPASAQVVIDTPAGGVRVGPRRDRHRDYDRRRRSSDRVIVRSRGGERCTTTIVRRSDGSTTRIRRCR